MTFSLWARLARGSGAREAVWFWWLVVSTIATVVAALVQWRIRTIFLSGPDFIVAHYLGYDSLAQDLGYVATVIGTILVSGAQWLLLRRYRLAVDWWIPVTVVAGTLDAVVLIPSVLRAVQGLAGNPTVPTLNVVVAAGGAALAASGLLVGTAQWFVLRGGGRTVAIGWIPATVVGGVIAGSITTAISSEVRSLPSALVLSALAAIGALLLAAVQGPILRKIVAY
jgi:hypothetical protein